MMLCECGCGREIIVKSHHKWYGVPKYINGHTKPNLGKKHSEETKRKISEAKKGKHHSEKTRRKISEANKGKHRSEEAKQKMSEVKSGKNNPLFGKHHSEETKQKISEAQKGEKHPNFNNWASRKPYCEKWTEEKREEIREQYGRKCIICDRDEKDNITKTNKMRKLSVHHVDEDKDQGCNGKSWNLKPLCMHCHGKVAKNE